MSRVGKSKIHDISYVFRKVDLEKLARELDKTVVSDRDLKSLSLRLNTLRSVTRSSESKDRLTHCYGRIDTLKINNSVDRIVESTFSLLENRGKLSRNKLQSKIKLIWNEVGHLWYDHALSNLNRRFIKIVVHYLESLQEIASRKSDSKQGCSANSDRKIDKKSSSLEQSDFFTMSEAESVDLAFELCEMARDFYQGQINEGIKKLRQLTPMQQEGLRKLCFSLGVHYPDSHKEEEPFSPHRMIEFVQAIVCYANGVAQQENMNFYPSENEIHMMFQEVEGFYDK